MYDALGFRFRLTCPDPASATYMAHTLTSPVRPSCRPLTRAMEPETGQTGSWACGAGGDQRWRLDVYSMGTALARAQATSLPVDVLVSNDWLSGRVVAADGHGLVLETSDHEHAWRGSRRSSPSACTPTARARDDPHPAAAY